MKKKLFFAAVAIVALASCTDNEFIGDNSPTTQQENAADEIQFGLSVQNTTRAGEFVGATAAEKLGGMFVVEGTKGSEQTKSPSTTVVFDNYLVGYTANTAGKTESNTHNWEYVGLNTTGITDRMTAATWSSLHSGATDAKSQTVKYWDYSTTQYDFYAYSTGTCEAIPVPATAAAPAASKIQVSRINQVTTDAPTGFTMRAASATDLKQCYYTDVTKVLKANYGAPVTLTFRNMTAKVRMALYETVPGYSVRAVEFYQDATTTLGTDISSNQATLFTVGDDKLPQSGIVTVLYPRVGTSSNTAADYNKASVTVTPDAGTAETKQEFGTLTAQYAGVEANEAYGKIVAGTKLTAEQAAAVNAALSLTGSDAYSAGGEITDAHATSYFAAISAKSYLGRTLPNATFAGSAADSYYKAVIPNTDGKALTLRVNYTLVATDGSGEEIKVYGAKAVVPPTYTKWLPNYAYTYIFKISDNSNGKTSTLAGDPEGLFPITFDAVVANFVDANAEQTTVTTVATPSITTYQQGHNTGTDGAYTVPNEYKVGSNKLYVQVMDNSSTPALVADLSASNSLLFSVATTGAPISEATVMDALLNRTNTPTGSPAASYKDASPVGRNGITLMTNANINNEATSIVNGVDNQPITVTKGKVAEINIANLSEGTYAYVYVQTAPSTEEKVYNVATDASTNYTKYYAVNPSDIVAETSSTDKAEAGKVYFVKNVDQTGAFVSWTFIQTKVGESSVAGLFEVDLSSASKATSYTDGYFYFDVYYQNTGAYAVKVIKVVE